MERRMDEQRDPRGPAAQSRNALWAAIRSEAAEAVRTEPLLGALIHAGLLHHATFQAALAYRFSLKLASGEMSEQILREIADETQPVDELRERMIEQTQTQIEVDEPEEDAMALLLGAEIDRPKPADEESEERMLRMMLEAQGRG